MYSQRPLWWTLCLSSPDSFLSFGNCHILPFDIHPYPMQFLSFGEGRPCDPGINQSIQFPFTNHSHWSMDQHESQLGTRRLGKIWLVGFFWLMPQFPSPNRILVTPQLRIEMLRPGPHRGYCLKDHRQATQLPQASVSSSEQNNLQRVWQSRAQLSMSLAAL